ncbi:MAG: ExbD/TolR family protein [Phycisphaerales bacterium]
MGQGSGRPGDERGGRAPVRKSRAGRSAERGGGDLPLNLTSAIDAVFLLLVYFMVATEFRSGEEVYRLDLPMRASGQAADPFELDEEPLRIRVDTIPGGGRASEAGSAIITVSGPWPQPDDFDGLRELLVGLLGDEATAGLYAIDHPLIVEPGRRTEWQHAMSAFNAAVRAGYRNVTMGAAR